MIRIICRSSVSIHKHLFNSLGLKSYLRSYSVNTIISSGALYSAHCRKEDTDKIRKENYISLHAYINIRVNNRLHAVCVIQYCSHTVPSVAVLWSRLCHLKILVKR
jgi:hypothetical protein